MTFIDTWDSDQPGAFWDSGLFWDVNIGPQPGDPTPYLDLVTSEHRSRARFMATLTTLIQTLVDDQVIIADMPHLFDLDSAIGDQEDKLGQWVGASRTLKVPLSGVYFTLDVDGLGLDQGVLQGPFDPNTYLTNLPDEAFRLLLRAKVLNNKWDGTTPSAYAIWAALFADSGLGILIQDTCQMHMILALTGPLPDILTLSLFLGGYLNVRPDGVAIDYYMTPGVPSTPYLGLDLESSVISGLDVGSFGFLNNGTGY